MTYTLSTRQPSGDVECTVDQWVRNSRGRLGMKRWTFGCGFQG